MSIARGLAMTGYRTPTLFAHRFSESSAADRLASLESYLGHVGWQFANRYTPDEFIRLSESLDLHEVDPGRVHVPTTVVAVDSDQLVPIEQMRELAHLLAGPVDFRVLESAFGHDAFLTEHTAIHRILTDCIEEKEHVTA
jgi:homoserine O-acetyltransferase